MRRFRKNTFPASTLRFLQAVCLHKTRIFDSPWTYWQLSTGKATHACKISAPVLVMPSIPMMIIMFFEHGKMTVGWGSPPRWCPLRARSWLRAVAGRPAWAWTAAGQVTDGSSHSVGRQRRRDQRSRPAGPRTAARRARLGPLEPAAQMVR